MLRRDGTPCPGAPFIATTSHGNLRDSILSSSGDSTANIEYTTEFQASLRNAGPRKRQTGIAGGPKRRNTGVTFTIHEDENAATANYEPNTATTRRSQTFARPPQRPSLMIGDPSKTRQDAGGQFKNSTSSRVSSLGVTADEPAKAPRQTARRTSIIKTDQGMEDAEIKKPARRGTIYIPSEDTTVPSIFMGVFSPIKSINAPEASDEGAQPKEVPELTGIAAQMAQKKGPRKSLVAVPPKRAPLHIALRPIQETGTPMDIHGQQTGKENVAPGCLDLKDKVCKDLEKEDLFDISKPEKRPRASMAPAYVRRRSFVPAKERRAVVSTLANPEGKHRSHSRLSLLQQPPRQESLTQGSRHDAAAAAAGLPKAPPTKTIRHPLGSSKAPVPINTYPSCAVKARVGPTPYKADHIPHKVLYPHIEQLHEVHIESLYPLLKEDIVNPALYEDNWLTHQEIAITQLVNKLFASSKGFEHSADHFTLRSHLLRLYQSPDVSTVQRRIQAALLYGALSIPKDVLAKGSRLVEDLGMKRQFLDLWTSTYDLSVLQAAAESVIGRQCPSTPRNSLENQQGKSSVGKPSPKRSKRPLEKYLETFLLRNEDAKSDGSLGWSYRRTVLRSLLLVHLLDQCRTCPDSPFRGCLFQESSNHKSSLSVLEALAKLMLPFVGDVVRPLSHVNYSVRHVQYPLEEFHYKIENLAVDLRDGVRLTRLVELLLYPSASRLLQTSTGEMTTTVAMPSGELLSLTEGEHDWPLSQHLKFPCLGRATKLFNVQIALSALSGVKGVDKIVRGMTAEDIVDGFREKTVALLWALVSKWGMGGLIDWEDVKSEIRCLERHNSTKGEVNPGWDIDEDAPEDGFQAHTAMLKRWTAVIAVKRGIQMNNLTTSFADGRIFGAVVDEYRSYLTANTTKVSNDAPLAQRLASIGCSSQFVRLFENDSSLIAGKVFDREFTLASLTFLCSRLLTASKLPRAATIIQRNWRALLQKRILAKQIMAARVAKECARVVEIRERLLWAKQTILKHWRVHRERRGQQQQPAARREDVPLQTKVTDVGDESDLWLSL